MAMSYKLKPELLSPAGDRECLKAAVANGADAVYLGTREFSARVHARNFSLEELGWACSYCHERGVSVYLAMNTLVKNQEVRPFFDVLSQAYLDGIDGVIIQHLSFIHAIKKNYSGLKVFISTQAAIGNLASASLVKSADRIILPRELSLDEVKKLTGSGVPTEVFVHGALCFSYSGLCLFSSFVGDRSGNRGCCAQLCRQRYNGCYPLSMKELCLVRRIPELVQAGITGFKIEGRMRSALYVAVATRLYRKAIDSYLAEKFAVPEKEMAEMEVVFNREFTEGFMFGERKLVAAEKPMNRGAFLGVIQEGEIVLQRRVSVGDGVGIWEGRSVRGEIVRDLFLSGRKASRAAVGERVSLGLKAAEGSRIYLTSSPDIRIKPDFTIKREAIKLPERKKIRAVLPGAVVEKKYISRRSLIEPRLLVKAYSSGEGVESLHAGADTVFYNIFSPDFPEARESQKRSPFGACLPRMMNDEELARALDLLRRKKPAAILAGNIGFLAKRAEFDVPVYLDYSLNAFNDLDLMYFRRYRVTPVLSPELSLQEMSELQDRDAAIFCHGDIVLMNTLVPLKEERLLDEKGLSFPVRRESDPGVWQVLNSRPFGLFNDIVKLHEMGFQQFFIDMQGKGAYFTGLYRKILLGGMADRRKRKGYTSGHLYRPVR